MSGKLNYEYVRLRKKPSKSLYVGKMAAVSSLVIVLVVQLKVVDGKLRGWLQLILVLESFSSCTYELRCELRQRQNMGKCACTENEGNNFLVTFYCNKNPILYS